MTLFDDLPDPEPPELKGQLLRVFQELAGGEWRTLSEISARTGDAHSSVSARIRDLRKHKFGGRTVERRHLGRGLYQYRIAPGRNGDESI